MSRSLLAYTKKLRVFISHNIWKLIGDNKFIITFIAPHQFCGKCGKDEHIAWAIKDHIWNSLPDYWQYGCLCVDCFSELCPKDFGAEDFITFRGGQR